MPGLGLWPKDDEDPEDNTDADPGLVFPCLMKMEPRTSILYLKNQKLPIKIDNVHQRGEM